MILRKKEINFQTFSSYYSEKECDTKHEEGRIVE